MRVVASLSTADKTMQCVKAYLIKRHDTGKCMLLEFTNGDSSQVSKYCEEVMHEVEEQKQAASAAGEERDEEVDFLSPQTTSRAKQ